MPKRTLTAKEKVALCGYLLTQDILTAYQLINPKSTATRESQQRQALRWLRQSDCQAYLNDIKAAQAQRIRDNTDSDTPDLTDRNNLLAELQLQYRAATDTKVRTDILARISDICRMKQADATQDTVDRIHMYVPLTCDTCPWLPQEMKDKKQYPH